MASYHWGPSRSSDLHQHPRDPSTAYPHARAAASHPRKPIAQLSLGNTCLGNHMQLLDWQQCYFHTEDLVGHTVTPIRHSLRSEKLLCKHSLAHEPWFGLLLLKKSHQLSLPFLHTSKPRRNMFWMPFLPGWEREKAIAALLASNLCSSIKFFSIGMLRATRTWLSAATGSKLHAIICRISVTLMTSAKKKQLHKVNACLKFPVPKSIQAPRWDSRGAAQSGSHLPIPEGMHMVVTHMNVFQHQSPATPLRIL